MAPSIVNPYAKKSMSNPKHQQQGTNNKKSVGTTAVKSGYVPRIPVANKTKSTMMTANDELKREKTSVSVNPKIPNATSTGHTEPTEGWQSSQPKPTLVPSSCATKVGSGTAKLTKATLPLARQNAQQPKSLKAKLKQEIEEIKRKTMVEKQKKQLRKEQKALEKKKREQERVQAIENEKRRKQEEEEEEKRRQEEQKMELERQMSSKAEEQQKYPSQPFQAPVAPGAWPLLPRVLHPTMQGHPSAIAYPASSPYHLSAENAAAPALHQQTSYVTSTATCWSRASQASIPAPAPSKHLHETPTYLHSHLQPAMNIQIQSNFQPTGNSEPFANADTGRHTTEPRSDYVQTSRGAMDDASTPDSSSSRDAKCASLSDAVSENQNETVSKSLTSLVSATTGPSSDTGVSRSVDEERTQKIIKEMTTETGRESVLNKSPKQLQQDRSPSTDCQVDSLVYLSSKVAKESNDTQTLEGTFNQTIEGVTPHKPMQLLVSDTSSKDGFSSTPCSSSPSVGILVTPALMAQSNITCSKASQNLSNTTDAQWLPAATPTPAHVVQASPTDIAPELPTVIDKAGETKTSQSIEHDSGYNDPFANTWWQKRGMQDSAYMNQTQASFPYHFPFTQGYAPFHPYISWHPHFAQQGYPSWPQHYHPGSYAGPLPLAYGFNAYPGPMPWQPAPTSSLAHNQTPNLSSSFANEIARNYDGYGVPQWKHLTISHEKKKCVPRQKKPANPDILCKTPLEEPSPFAITHVLMDQPFTITKKQGESFGLSIKEEKRSVLVEADRLLEKEPQLTIDSAGTTNDTASKEFVVDVAEGAKTCSAQRDPATLAAPSSKTQNENAEADKPVRKKRRRIFFAVMEIVDASKQNERNPSDHHLIPGDVVLSIDAHSTGGMPFRDACDLFSNHNMETKKDNEGNEYVCCSLTIARRKTLPQLAISSATTSIASAASLTNNSLNLKSVTNNDIAAFAGCLLRAMQDPQRLLGRSISDSLIQKLIATVPRLCGRDIFMLKKAFMNYTKSLELTMTEKAISSWQIKWREESEQIRSSSSLPCLTLAQRSELRASPRPVKGCRCGSKEHEFVNDINCPLYSDLRKLSSRKNETPVVEHVQVKLSRTLNAVETAFKDRIIKLKSEKKYLEEEALFVGEMENLQVQKLKKAVFAPSLTVIVLSAVAELQDEFAHSGEKRVRASVVSAIFGDMINNGGSEEGAEAADGDDDVPIAALLGKRKAGAVADSAAGKKQKLDVDTISFKYLAKLILLICDTWGHVYREPDHGDYAWRWEVYHGQHSEAEGVKWGANCLNPRQPGNLTLENIPFILNEEVIEVLGRMDEGKKEKDRSGDRELALLAYLLSSTRTGIYDELIALIRLGVLSLKAGIPRLSKNWSTKVDLLMLSEMHETWSPDLDKSGLYCVARKIRRRLNKDWVINEEYGGWALRDDPNDIIFDFDEYDEWRAAFEDKQQALSNNVYGIGRFGI